VLVEHRMASLDEVSTVLPKDDPCEHAIFANSTTQVHYNSRAAYSFFAWDHTVEGAPKRDIRADLFSDIVVCLG
jgi:hypothetical protein